jgi:RNA polymerase sigma-70 factor (ECF subfamily)
MGVDIRLQVVTMLPRLRRFARSLAGTADRADDLVQATCERALKSAGQWQPGTRLDSWLYRVMQNLWIDEMRRAKKQGQHVPEHDALAVVGEDGARAADARIAAGEVLAALDRLPPEQRSVVSLVCIEELSYREAAEVLEVPIGTVMSRLARARAVLAAVLSPDGLANGSTARGA